MAANDRILVDGILDDRVIRAFPSAKRDEVFEFFALEQLLKFADLSVDELSNGWIDGGDDGGIDGFYVFVNGHLVADPETLRGVRRADIQVWLINCKHHDTFKQATVDKLVATASDLFDFRKSSEELKQRYSGDVLEARERLIAVFKLLGTRIEGFDVRVVYASRGDTAHVGAEVEARANQVNEIVRGLFGQVSSRFDFVGSAELIGMNRKSRRYSLVLPFFASLGQGERYVLLAHLKDYAAFVTDEEGQLRRYLFDSNVRDFVGLNRVNEDIAESLGRDGGPDFWWLNNGVTILATKAMITGQAITMDDVQIVNGLQTTESIARYFARGGADVGQRSVLVKVIKTDDPAVRDAIIKATNNQTAVEQQSLRATDKIQRDLEQVLLAAGWYYDRRQNFYANQGVAPDRIVSPLYLAAASVGLVLKLPSVAARLKQKVLRHQQSYEQIFSEKIPLNAWPKMVGVLKAVDAELNNLRSPSGVGQNFLRTWRHLVALIVVARLRGRFSFSAEDLAGIDLSLVSPESIKQAWEVISGTPGRNVQSVKKKLARVFVEDVCKHAATKLKILHSEAVERSNLPSLPPKPNRTNARPLDSAFIDSVDAKLPAQPWPVGVHLEVAKVLNVPRSMVSAAIDELVRKGKRYRQEKGIVYAPDGSVINKADEV